ncbi:nitrite/sulfite reductase [Congregibacter litoralis]|uniref:Sulfite reductase, beta subunit (Hemoprotein) n=1 Tax=Congregibacter litoralis KT71 TaxID=314285 RepID=A4A4I0_9GAMM|nr:nitrite/sulfite reductase [Congregibacter litoralis]EAQ99096.1 Sulfite reductase, beta subunit (hemoprotein) [Congregibacter litoralis KT71]
MYQYDNLDQTIVDERVAQFRDQTARYLDGELSDAEFLPLRLQNGLYVQRLAPMLRIAVPYGLISSIQLRAIAEISRRYDKGYGHISTRQNIQLNWPRLADVPDILADLAAVQMHAIQTSGNCIRNTTTDQFAGVAADEIVDPRPYCEIIRQWSTLHPEFAFLPRKFKIAVNGAEEDRAAIHFHDIGIELYRNEASAVRLKFLVGGGLGRTPVVGSMIRDDLDPADMLSYLEAILRVYNLHGRRDNKYKARIKILVKAMGVEAFSNAVDAEWDSHRGGPNTLTEDALAAVSAHFTAPDYGLVDGSQECAALREACASEPLFAAWVKRNTQAHRQPGYRAVTVTLKATGQPPGDISASQMDALADLADAYSFGELRTTHEQNIVLADVRESELRALWDALQPLGLAGSNAGYITDMICCPGGDFCSLANAKSLPVAQALQERFEKMDYQFDLGPIELNISGCMNACGHHHVGHIGILGVDKKGQEFYQVCIGGSQAGTAQVAKILGPSFSRADLPDAIEWLLQRYLELRDSDEERFLQVYQRCGVEPFKEAVYGQS